jgi:hypothetical protein
MPSANLELGLGSLDIRDCHQVNHPRGVLIQRLTLKQDVTLLV